MYLEVYFATLIIQTIRSTKMFSEDSEMTKNQKSREENKYLKIANDVPKIESLLADLQTLFFT